MSHHIHSNARTTPLVRQHIKDSGLKQHQLAKKYSVSRLTIKKWQSRDGIEDRSHRPHKLHTTLSPLQEDM